MADSIKVEVENADKVAQALRQFRGDMTRVIQEAGKTAGNEIIETRGLKNYPPANQGIPQSFKTEKSRRYFFAALRRGEIEVPYRRGGRRSQEYDKQFYVTAQGLDTIIGNRAYPYNVYLTDQTRQSRYMARLGWRKLYDVAVEKTQRINEIYNRLILSALKRLGLM